MKEFKDYFSKSEIVLWSSSVMVIIISFCVFDRINYMTLCASLIGVTSLIFNAKGNPFGQLLMVVFSLLYGIIRLSKKSIGLFQQPSQCLAFLPAHRAEKLPLRGANAC